MLNIINVKHNVNKCLINRLVIIVNRDKHVTSTMHISACGAVINVSSYC